MRCQRCKKNDATIHLTELVKGDKREKHLCEHCAADEGVAVKQHVSINDVLNSFLMSQASVQHLAQLRCPDCGMTFVEFRSQGLLGCPKDYDVFGEALGGMIERAHDGHTHHTGKAPGQPVTVDPKRTERQRLQGELRDAVEAENYEVAARLRDQLSELEKR